MQKILVIIPAYNEEETINEVVRRSLKYADVSVTNDGSQDSTAAILKKIKAAYSKKKYKLNIITHKKSTHIPKGLQDGLIYGVKKKYDMMITMDAGLSHDPDALPDFINHDPNIDVVIGQRAKIENVPLYRKIISWLAARIVNYSLTNSWFTFTGPGLRDCTSGFRRYSVQAAKIIASTKLESKAFDFHMEALALCYRSGLKVSEIPIHYVFSNSSFNKNVLKQAMKFGIHLIFTKGKKASPDLN